MNSLDKTILTPFEEAGQGETCPSQKQKQKKRTKTRTKKKGLYTTENVGVANFLVFAFPVFDHHRDHHHLLFVVKEV